MAFLDTSQQDDEQEKRLKDSDPETSGGAAIFGNAGGGGGAPASPTNKPVTQNSSNTGFVNLQKYLDANKSQASGMGQKVAGSVDQKAQGAQNQISDLSNQFGQQVKDNTVNYDPNAVNKAISDAQGLKAGQSYDPNDVSAFQKQATATYNGPNDFTKASGYSNASQALGTAENSLNSLNSESGRQSLLRDQFRNSSKNGYNQGESTLDQALVETNPESQKAFGDLQSKYAGIHNLLNTATAGANKQVSEAQATDANTAKQAQDALGTYATNEGGKVSGGSGALGKFSGDVYNNYNTAASNYKTAQSNLQNAAANNSYTPDQLKALGLTPGMRTYGVNLTPGYIQAGLNPTLANTATADQYAQQAALAQLAGVLPNGPGATGTMPLNAADVDQAGTGAGVNGNAMYSLAPTYMSHVNANKTTYDQLQNQLTSNQGTVSKLQGMYDTAHNQFVQGTGDNFDKAVASGDIVQQPNGSFVDQNGTTYASKQDYVNKMTSPAYAPIFDQSLRDYLSTYHPQGSSGPSGWDTYYSAQQNINNLNNEMGLYGGTLGSPPEPSNRTAPANSVALNPSGVGGAAFMAKGGEVLDANARKHIAPHNFALPKQHKYPIHDIEHARNALARVSQFGTPEEKEIVRRQVHKKYPSLAKPYAEGGEVDNGSSYDKIMNFLQGGKVPGRAKTAPGVNSYSNDFVEARLSPHEIVIPRSIAQSSDPVSNGAKFIAEVLAKKAKK